jgi:acyl carrier protein
VAIASIQWSRYLAQRQNQADRSFYSELFSERDADGAQAVSQLQTKAQRPSQTGPELAAIHALPAAMRETALLRTVADIVRRTLGLHSGEEIDPDVPLSELGMDSLLAIELRNSLSGVLHRQFPSTIIFDYPTLRTMAKYLDREVLSVHEDTPAAAPVTQVRGARTLNENSLDILDTIEQMSDQEVEAWFE